MTLSDCVSGPRLGLSYRCYRLGPSTTIRAEIELNHTLLSDQLTRSDEAPTSREISRSRVSGARVTFSAALKSNPRLK